MITSVVLIVSAILNGLSLGCVFRLLPQEIGNRKKNSILGCTKIVLFSTCYEYINFLADAYEVSIFIKRAAFLMFIATAMLLYISKPTKHDSNM